VQSFQQPLQPQLINFLYEGKGAINGLNFEKSSEQGWNLLFYSEPISTNHSITYKISKLNKDKSGIILGVCKDKNRDVALKSCDANVIGLNGKGFSYKYNTEKIASS